MRDAARASGDVSGESAGLVPRQVQGEVESKTEAT